MLFVERDIYSALLHVLTFGVSKPLPLGSWIRMRVDDDDVASGGQMATTDVQTTLTV